MEASGDVQIVTDFPAQNEVTALGIREFASIARQKHALFLSYFLDLQCFSWTECPSVILRLLSAVQKLVERLNFYRLVIRGIESTQDLLHYRECEARIAR